MIFKEIRLVNFRQYSGENEFEFPISNDNFKNITLLIARNGVGKTTFLQAFRFCFYGENQGALKLPKSDELITNSVENQLTYGERASVEVTIKFIHNEKTYIASRNVEFEKRNVGLKRVSDSNITNFELLEESETLGIQKVDKGEERIKQMMPFGLANVYMFDGERIEEPISSPDFQKGIRESIIGVLGLEKLQKANDFLGSTSEASTVIGQLYKKIKPTTSSENAILLREKTLQEKNIEKRKQVEQKNKAIDSFEHEILEAREAQKKILELKKLSLEFSNAQMRYDQKKEQIDNLVLSANSLASKLLLNLELAKLYPKYKKFLDNSEDAPVVFENLYSSVIDEILKKHECICGRPVEENSDIVEHLRKLYVLPQDNALYLNGLENMFSSLSDMPQERQLLKDKRMEILKEQKNLDSLGIIVDEAHLELKKAEQSYGKDNQTNIDYLSDMKAAFIHTRDTLINEIQNNENVLKGMKGQLEAIKNDNEYNLKVKEAIRYLETLKRQISEDLKVKKELARKSIQDNMNRVLRGITNQRYAQFQVELDENYKLVVYKIIAGFDEMDEATEILSTGENVVMYLSFLRALLLTIEQNSEFSSFSGNGVIMDAALSNLDEEHIKQISNKILGNFDQLIFLSSKKQLRDELINGIKDKVAKIYVLTKTEVGNIEAKDLKIEDVNSFIEYGEGEELQ